MRKTWFQHESSVLLRPGQGTAESGNGQPAAFHQSSQPGAPTKALTSGPGTPADSFSNRGHGEEVGLGGDANGGPLKRACCLEIPSLRLAFSYVCAGRPARGRAKCWPRRTWPYGVRSSPMPPSLANSRSLERWRLSLLPESQHSDRKGMPLQSAPDRLSRVGSG